MFLKEKRVCSKIYQLNGIESKLDPLLKEQTELVLSTSIILNR